MSEYGSLNEQYGELVSSVVYNGERVLNFNRNWRFQREQGNQLIDVQNPHYDDSSWRQLNLPHDWSIELAFNAESPATHEAGYLDGGIGWYRKTFTLPTHLQGKRISIDFDGVYMDSTVYVNGQEIGNYPFGYNAFSYDLTNHLYTDGRENVVVVKVHNVQPSSRWYSGSGIYRQVHLTVTNDIHVARYGTFVTTPDLKEHYALGKAKVNLKTKVTNQSDDSQEVLVQSLIYDEADEIVARQTALQQVIEKGTTTQFEADTIIQSPILWAIDRPYRYKIVTEVLVDASVVDTYETRFGIRYFEFDADEGFSLNGDYMKLHGACMHHDLGALGAATNYRAVERQLTIMKEMGVNSIRVTHNPASPELLEVANTIGLLVVEEAFDSWQLAKKTYDYSRFFAQWAEHDIKEMVDRGKNEPSIIMWSIGNEIYDTTDENGVTIAKDLVGWVKEIDTTRPTTIGEDKTRADKVNVTPLNPFIKEIFDAVDLVGLNYSENNYAGYHEQNPNWKIYGAETSSATRSRGVYMHPYTYNQSTQYENLQQSSYDNDYVAWGRTAEDAWKYDRDLKHIAGQYIWTGFDYIGEPTPYYNEFPAKSSYFGAVDTAGFPKDIFYYYQSQWREEPMLHLLPHWNWATGETVRVLAYTNVHKVELFLNGQSLGEKSYVTKQTTWGSSYKETTEGKTYLEWAVPFEQGVLKAVGKNEHNEVIVEDEVVTAGAPAKVRLTADRKVLQADGQDVSFVTVDVVDYEGNIVPTANQCISFNLSGVGELIGVDNGNASSIEKYKANERQVFNGKALAIVQACQVAGEIVLEANAEGLQSDTIEIGTVGLTNEVNLEVEDETERLGAIDSIEKTIVFADQGQQPALPRTVKAHYRSGASRFIPVRWDLTTSTSTQYTITGTVDAGEVQAIAEVTVRQIIAVEQVTLATLPHHSPVLPKEVMAYYSDGTNRQQAVTWSAIAKDQLEANGHLQVTGAVGEWQTTANVRVTDVVGGEQNISRAKNGYHYPKVNASYTNEQMDSEDRVEAIHDDLISYGDNPHNRWTNWCENPRSQDWVSVTFGDFGPVEYDVDHVMLYWYADAQVSHPERLRLEAKTEKGWEQIECVTSELSEMTVGEVNLYTFPAVKTSEVKVIMTAQKDRAIGITEMKIFSRWAAAYQEAKVGSIQLGGEEIITEFKKDPDGSNYKCRRKSSDQQLDITATGEDNTSITIVPADESSQTARIIAKSEDGQKVSVYKIHFDA